MAFVVEDGSGIVDANSYVSIAFSDSYATDRGLTAWDTPEDPAKQVALIAATDYIEKRFGYRFLGQQQFPEEKKAKATFSMTAQPAAASTVTIGGVVFAYEPLLTFESTMITLRDLINDDNTGYEATLGPGMSIVVRAPMEGIEGNTITVSTTATGSSWNSTTLFGGNSEGFSQGLSFPRAYLYRSDGYEIKGIPFQLKNATVEYAVRALTAVLLPDPVLGSSGQVVQRTFDKVGPIETEVSYMRSVMEKMGSYPSVDSWLRGFMNSGGGGVYR